MDVPVVHREQLAGQMLALANRIDSERYRDQRLAE
jgi:hypothetical protein